MKISVAMATYNGELFVREQLESIFAQTRPVDEVVICDDCSIDHTVEIIHEFIEAHNLARWSLYINDKNVGYIKNFYSAIARTTGDIIFLSDQDDIWDVSKIKVMENIFEQYSEISALNCAFQKIDHAGVAIKSSAAEEKNNYHLIRETIMSGELKQISFDVLLLRNISPGCTMAFRRKCCDFYLENASICSPHDWEINFFSALTEGTYFYNSKLVNYRIHSNNTIGLASPNGKSFFTMKKDQNFRLIQAEDQFNKAEIYLNSEWYATLDPKRRALVSRYWRIVKKRAEALKSRRIGKWLAALLYLHDYIGIIGFRAIIGDLIYIIKTR